MPGFDRTGPMGAGPLTGGRRGLCNAAARRGRGRVSGGYGFERGISPAKVFRSRRGFRGGAGGSPPPAYDGYPLDDTVELGRLKARASSIQEELDEINKRMAEL